MTIFAPQKGYNNLDTTMNSDVLQVQSSLGIVGRSAELQKAISKAVLAAPYDVNVLITGENGVGKEVFHKIIHSYSKRKTKKCFAINCGALPEGTINSELFGHVKGAFTGATADRKGYFEEANGGTLFLDEVGELPLETQARLLRVLQNGEYIRVGSNQVSKTDVRVVAATNKNLLKAIEQGKFREDLYYRLATICIDVPPLRHRPEDIELLFKKFANDIASRYNMPPLMLDESGRRALIACQWPGNIRQLESVVLQLSILLKDRLVTEEILRRFLPQTEARLTISKEDASHENDFAPGEKKAIYSIIYDMRKQIEDLQKKLNIEKTPTAVSHAALPMSPAEEFEEQEAEEVSNEAFAEPIQPAAAPTTPPVLLKKEREKNDIIEALARNNNNRRKAAQELGISERTIHRKLTEYGIVKN